MADLIELVRPSVPALRRYARSMVRDHTWADDLVQECLEHAIDHWHERKNEGDPRAWLFSIVHNLAISQLRQSRRRGLHTGFDEAAAAAPARAPTQEHGLRHAELLRALGELSEDHRAVLFLISVEGLSYAEVGEVLQIPIGTVMSRLSRARQSLAVLLEPEPARNRRPTLRRLK
ncbi:MAG TPA: sigma-70 family RNA polymerase sigma factor [Polyangiales bacterium]|nr:sigma-70 family RNA polymerase sigma factor [Polyangiales bacterium]